MKATEKHGNILIVDRLPLRRAQLIHFLEHWAMTKDLEIIVSDFSDLVALRNLPGCRLIILSVGGESLDDPWLTSVQRIARAIHADVPLVLIGEAVDPETIEVAIRSGASAYISGNLEAETALAALTFVLVGGSYFPADALRTISAVNTLPPANLPNSPPSTSRDNRVRNQPLHRGRGSSDQDASAPQELSNTEGTAGALTTRQRQVLACLKGGLSNKQIARQLDTSEATIKVHVRHVMKRLGAKNRTHAVVLALNMAVVRFMPESPLLETKQARVQDLAALA